MENETLRILIADDDPSLRASMAGVLELECFHVETAADGFEAIEKIKAGRTDIVFMDIKMPGINGVDAFKEVKKISPSTIVVMMTAYPVYDLIKEALREGAYSVLSKPFDMRMVIDTIKEVSAQSFVAAVENDQVLSASFQESLSANGCASQIAADVADALVKIQENASRIVVVNMRPPHNDTVELYDRLKTINPKIPLLFINGHTNAEKADDLLRSTNSYCYLHKPFEPANLLKTLKDLSEAQRRKHDCK